MQAELVGVVVIALVSTVVLACSYPVVRAAVPLCLLAFGVGMTGENYQRALSVAARQAKVNPSLVKKKPPGQAPVGESELPQTVNRRAKKRTQTPDGSSADSPPPPSALPQTRNPRKIDTSPDGDAPLPGDADASAPVSPPNPQSPWANVGSVNGFAYTMQAQQVRRDEFQFRPVVEYQASDARERMLNSLYKELMDVSVKRDPALRLPNTSDPCEPLRGLTIPHIVS